jgi:hypothetical protein
MVPLPLTRDILHHLKTSSVVLEVWDRVCYLDRNGKFRSGDKDELIGIVTVPLNSCFLAFGRYFWSLILFSVPNFCLKVW